MRQHIEPLGRFKTEHQWLKEAGLSQNGLKALERGNIPRVDTLAKLAKVVGEDPARVLALAGYISESSAGMALSDEESLLMASFRALPQAEKQALIGVAEGLLLRAHDLASRHEEG